MIREAVLKELERREWTLLKLSQESNVPYSRIHDWLAADGRGTRGPKIESLEKIMQVLGLTINRSKK